jgi:hypothetical protein
MLINREVVCMVKVYDFGVPIINIEYIKYDIAIQYRENWNDIDT